MAANDSESGANSHRQRGRRITGSRTSTANDARQKARCIPRVAAGQSSKIGALANSPLELHSNAAARIQSRPVRRVDEVLSDGATGWFMRLSTGLPRKP